MIPFAPQWTTNISETERKPQCRFKTMKTSQPLKTSYQCLRKHVPLARITLSRIECQELDAKGPYSIQIHSVVSTNLRSRRSHQLHQGSPYERREFSPKQETRSLVSGLVLEAPSKAKKLKVRGSSHNHSISINTPICSSNPQRSELEATEEINFTKIGDTQYDWENTSRNYTTSRELNHNRTNLVEHQGDKFVLDYKTVAEPVPIQGFDNSCYMDSSLVSLFLCDKSFFKHLEKWSPTTTQDPPGKPEELRQILNSLLNSNVNVQSDVRYRTMLKFRKIMSKYSTSYLQEEKDAEEFISTLFSTALKCPPFYKIAGDDDGGYVFQTYGNPGSNNFERSTSVQQLIDYSFQDSDILLEGVPNPGFVIKLPVTNGKHMFSSVFPNLVLNLEKVMVKSSDLSPGKSSLAYLSAVICLRSNHYTTFVRMRSDDIMSPWLYLDSFLHSQYSLISNLSEFLAGEQHTYDGNDKHLKFLMKQPYICIYLPQNI